jgi:hypothetical protein
MITELLIFLAIYLIGFVYYAGKYTSGMQDINELDKRLRIKDVDKSKVEAKKSALFDKIKRLKKWGYLIAPSIFILNILTFYSDKRSSSIDFIYCSIMFGVFILLHLLINWMKGAGTVNNNPTSGRTRSPWL